MTFENQITSLPKMTYRMCICGFHFPSFFNNQFCVVIICGLLCRPFAPIQAKFGMRQQNHDVHLQTTFHMTQFIVFPPREKLQFLANFEQMGLLYQPHLPTKDKYDVLEYTMLLNLVQVHGGDVKSKVKIWQICACAMKIMQYNTS